MTSFPFVMFDEQSGQIVKDWSRGLPNEPLTNRLDLSDKREVVRRANAFQEQENRIQELQQNISRAEGDVKRLVEDRWKLVEALRELDSAWHHESAAVRQLAKGRATRLLREFGETK